MSAARATTVLPVDPERPDPAAIGRAAAAIRSGGLVAFPTETVYGLGADALDAAAVRRIFAAKERPSSDPLIVHLAGAELLPEVVTDVPEVAHRLAASFWPGPLTLVLPRAAHVPTEVTAGLDTVATRVPAHPVARALLAASGVPIAAPSANLFSRPSPTTAADVLEDLDGRVDLLLDGGPTTLGVESTVLDLTDDPPRILRPGGVTAEQLAAALGRPVSRSARVEDVHRSPGTMTKHYAPRGEMLLIVGEPDRALAELERRTAEARAVGRRVGLLVPADDAARLGHVSPGVALEVIGARADPAAAARSLYAALRRLERTGAELILARDVGDAGLGATIRDRLTRAAGGRVVEAG